MEMEIKLIEKQIEAKNKQAGADTGDRTIEVRRGAGNG
jgi:hypothetical protein